MTTINIADDWLDEVRASLGARAELASQFEPADAGRIRRTQRSDGRCARLRQHRCARQWHAEVTTDLLQRADGGWRFRIYRRGESIPLADMLPLLDHLGLRALDERAFGFAFDGGRCGSTMSVWPYPPAPS